MEYQLKMKVFRAFWSALNFELVRWDISWKKSRLLNRSFARQPIRSCHFRFYLYPFLIARQFSESIDSCLKKSTVSVEQIWLKFLCQRWLSFHVTNHLELVSWWKIPLFQNRFIQSARAQQKFAWAFLFYVTTLSSFQIILVLYKPQKELFKKNWIEKI